VCFKGSPDPRLPIKAMFGHPELAFF
jgi:hypothetical protein